MLRPLLLACCALFALGPGSASPPTDSALLDHMEGMKEHLKGVAMGLSGGETEATLGHVAELQRLVLLSKLEAPANLDQLPEDEQGAHRVRFRRDLATLLQDLAGMEIEILDGDPAAAFERVKGSLFELREEAHARYQRSK